MCSSIDGCWSLSIDGGLSLLIDGGLSLSINGGLSLSNDGGLCLPIDVDTNRAGRMWVSCCELLVSHDSHGIAQCSLLCRCRRSMLWRGCRSVLVEIRRSMFEV
ncbi:hypothetical protein DY000_02007333 [Brassica cretica]|uniref:Uncharacterized protein n=1 Tax=Brassica cretica TaxID=69181 RepID=A0ABQ7C3A5_BRACR|nr:hypothetical protein DY000_02007333 [Brassica cretica]